MFFQFSLPNPATVDNIFGVNRFGASLWTDASQGSQRLPVRVTQAPEQRGPVRQEHVRRDCVEYLRAFVKNPSQYEADDAPSQAAASRSETATPPYASFSMEAADCIANANSQPTAVASVIPQEVAESTLSQSSDRGRLESTSTSTNLQACI